LNDEKEDDETAKTEFVVTIEGLDADLRARLERKLQMQGSFHGLRAGRFPMNERSKLQKSESELEKMRQTKNDSIAPTSPVKKKSRPPVAVVTGISVCEANVS
jgi:hypothetical protein